MELLGCRATGSIVVVHGLGCPGMWDFPKPGIKPMSPALAGRFLPLSHQGSPSKQCEFLFPKNIPPDTLVPHQRRSGDLSLKKAVPVSLAPLQDVLYTHSDHAVRRLVKGVTEGMLLRDISEGTVRGRY